MIKNVVEVEAEALRCSQDEFAMALQRVHPIAGLPYTTTHPQLLRDTFGARMRSECSAFSNTALYKKTRVLGNQQSRRPVHEAPKGDLTRNDL